MHSDQSFPLHSVPSRVRTAILDEFQGRCPSMQEVARIPDKQWLSVPGIGSSALCMIRSVMSNPAPASHTSLCEGITDAELLERLEAIQEELLGIRQALRMKTGRTPGYGTAVQGQKLMHPDLAAAQGGYV